MDLILTFFDEYNMETLMFTTLRILLVLVIAWVALKVVRKTLQRFEAILVDKAKSGGEMPGEASKRAETLARLLRQGVVIVVWVIALLVVLREIGVDVAPILASAGVIGLAVGFGAQNLVRDVISGFFLILENQVRVGDVAVVNGTGGLVEAINFRTLVLRDLSGTVHVFPNGSVNTLANLTREWSAYVFDIGVAYEEDMDRVMAIMREVGAQLRADPEFGPLLIDDVEVFGVDNFADSAVTIKGRLRTKPIKQWDVGREFRRRLKIAFDEAGVNIPFPQRTVHVHPESQQLLLKTLGDASA
ncbi:MAG: mechanosensitive ion channel protein MscS [Thiotrichales bacterium SG8_50]|nr:MAG: mechanosensitive ion channel protein MscS [Thiotrichales bacterium SG8_50]